MARLLKFTGADKLSAAAPPQVVAAPAAGAALARLGGKLAGSAGQLASVSASRAWSQETELRFRNEALKRQADTFELVKARLQLDKTMKELEAEQRPKTRDGEPFYTETMLARRRAEAERLAMTFSEAQQTQVTQALLRDGVAYSTRLAEQEYADRGQYFVEGVRSMIVFLAGEVREGTTGHEAAWQRASDLVEALPLPEPQRRELGGEADAALATAWIERQPSATQIDGLERLERATAKGTVSADLAGREDGSDTAFLETAAMLQLPARRRLLEAARRNRVRELMVEETGLLARIGENAPEISEDQILGNVDLTGDQKKRLLGALHRQKHRRKTEQTALEALLDRQSRARGTAPDPSLADQAFNALDTGEMPARILARGIALGLGMLPKPFVQTLLRAGQGRDPGELDMDFRMVAELAAHDPGVVDAASDNHQLRRALNVWQTLRETAGFRPGETAEIYLQNRQAERRAQLLKVFNDLSDHIEELRPGARGILQVLSEAQA